MKTFRRIHFITEPEIKNDGRGIRIFCLGLEHPDAKDKIEPGFYLHRDGLWHQNCAGPMDQTAFFATQYDARVALETYLGGVHREPWPETK